MAGSKDENFAAAGCFVCLAVIAIVAIVYGKVDVAGWFKPTPPVGRYQIVTGRVAADDPERKEEPEIIKLDTATGKTWVFLPSEFNKIPGTDRFYFEDNRWVDADDDWTAKQKAKGSPSPSPTKSP